MSRPAHNHRIGSLPATIWRNLAEKGNWYSVKLTRGYQDLLPVDQLVDLAPTWIMHQLEAETEGVGNSLRLRQREAAEKVAEVVTHAAEAAQEHVIKPVADAVGITKRKKARFVRQKTEKKPRVKATPLAPKSKTAAGMMMS
ncbi:MAG: hypothetical protein JWO38_769, partial [Gemmataceae bacterium]|nr:hypothetical protein [Gemmataceae bacterium]